MSETADKEGQANMPSLGAGFSLAKYLELLPGGARLAGFVIIAFLGMAGYLVYSATGVERIIVIFLVFGLIFVVIVSAHMLQKNTRLLEEKQQKELENKLVLDAPKAGTEHGKNVKFEHDVFVAAPMASLAGDEARKLHRDNVVSVVETIKTRCDFKDIYYAGYKASSEATFDPPEIALKLNVPRMRASKRFMLIYSENVATSALIEVGMALGLGKPSVWFVKRGLDLPYLMRGASAAPKIKDFPPISIYEFSDFAQIIQYVNTNGTALFDIDQKQ